MVISVLIAERIFKETIRLRKRDQVILQILNTGLWIALAIAAIIKAVYLISGKFDNPLNIDYKYNAQLHITKGNKTTLFVLGIMSFMTDILVFPIIRYSKVKTTYIVAVLTCQLQVFLGMVEIDIFSSLIENDLHLNNHSNTFNVYVSLLLSAGVLGFFLGLVFSKEVVLSQGVHKLYTFLTIYSITLIGRFTGC